MERRFGSLEPFVSSLFRISIAKENLGKLEPALPFGSQVSADNIVQRQDAETGENIIYISGLRSISLEQRHIYGNIIIEARHALDDAFSEAAVQLGRSDGSGIYFPICRNAGDFEGEVKRKCRRVAGELIEACRSLEPYEGGKGHVLWLASKVAAMVKHGQVLPFIPVLTEIGVQKHVGITPYVPRLTPNENGEIAVAKGVVDGDANIRLSIQQCLDETISTLRPEGKNYTPIDIINACEHAIGVIMMAAGR